MRVETKLDSIESKLDDFIQEAKETIATKADKTEVDDLKKEVKSKSAWQTIIVSLLSIIFTALISFFITHIK